jgi:hypothetical protein
MARLRIEGSDLVVRLNPLERLGALRWRVSVPLDSISSVGVERKPLSSEWFMRDVKLGFAARTAPGQLAVALSAAKYARGGEIFVAVYLNRPSVIVDTHGGRWRRLVVSERDPADTVKAIDRAR